MMKGFLGYQPLFMIDLVLVSQIGILPLLGLALYFVKKKKYRHHAIAMLAITGILLIAVVLFETEIRLHGGMGEIAKTMGKLGNVETSFFKGLFWFHLLLCGLVAPLWIYTIYRAIRNFTFSHPQPTAYGKTHRKLAIISLMGAFGIAVTGMGCYFFAFVM